MNKAIFLDRDGVLNVDSKYVYEVNKLEIIDGNIEALKGLKKLGFLLIIITNQSGIGRGYYTIDDTNVFNLELENKLKIKFDEIFICQHIAEDNCKCRKPNIYNLELARDKFDIDLKQSYFIGDKKSDIICGKNAGCKTAFVNSLQYKINNESDYVVSNLLEFYNKIKNDF